MTVVAVALPLLAATRAAAEDAEEAFRRGQKHFAAEEYRDALAAYELAYEKAPLPDIVFNIAQCHRNLGEYKKAKRAFERYLDEQPEAENQKQVEKTLEQLEILNKARRDVRSRRYKRAAKRYEEALQIEPLITIHRDLGRTFERLGRYDEAIASYREYLLERKNADDREDIEAAIERLEAEVNGKGNGLDPVGTDTPRPIYKKWWFWVAVGGAAVATTALTLAITGDGIPGSDLGNVDFPQGAFDR